MARIQYELFLQILTENPRSCDEIEVRIGGEPTVFGYLPVTYSFAGDHWFRTEHKCPFWVGRCDYPGGVDFYTAHELLNYPLFEGRSFHMVWHLLEFDSAAGMPIDLWLQQQPISGICYDDDQDLWYLPETE